MRRFVSKFLMFFVILLMLLQPVRVEASQYFADDTYACLNATKKIEKEYQIKKHLLTTISSVETGRWNEKEQQSLAWPWTINAQGKGQFFKTKAEAVKAIKKLQAQGVKSIDVGCMQINLSYHGKAFKSIEDALDPQKNVTYAAKYLKSLYLKKGKDWLKAAMAYHSTTPHKAQRYKKKIVSAYEVVRMASKDNDERLFGERIEAQKAALKEVRKAPAAVKVAAVKPEAVRKGANKIDARAWREAKLAEYRRNKLIASN